MVGWIVVGAIGGWLAGYLMHQDKSFDLMDVITGVLGAMVGGGLLTVVGLGPDNLIGDIIAATIGAIILTIAFEAYRKRNAA